MTIIKKIVKKEKCRCNGQKKNCKSCNNTGIFKDHKYIFIDEKNKIACDSDNLA